MIGKVSCLCLWIAVLGCEPAAEPVTPIVSKTRIEHTLSAEPPPVADEESESPPPGDDPATPDESAKTASPAPKIREPARPARTVDPATGCLEGDRRVGPVCVTTSSFGFGVRHIASSVYFADDPERKIVWESDGYVDQATRETLIVSRLTFVEGVGLKDMPHTYRWNGTKFAEKDQTPSKSKPPKAKPPTRQPVPDDPWR